MLTFYNHVSWFILIFLGFILSSLISFILLYLGEVISLSVNLFSVGQTGLNLSFYIDWIRTSFIRVVLLIRSVIIVYSYNYISPYSKSNYFIWLTFIFVVSMLLVVTMSNLFFLMLGWDGLGLISFFLIVYFQNQSSITSGLFTLLINRIGDCFFLLVIVLFSYNYGLLYPFSSNLLETFTLAILLITFMTKRAIFPFSPWLPLAIAAPTPISALVHSSTLVTAGLYLIIRYSYLLYRSFLLIKILLVLSLFTSFYAGINAIFEVDLKKMIALSTLSHLGFIGIAFASGLIQLAFFHILTHALFKSLLFITIGDIMINLNHSQDIRYLSSGISYTPMSCSIIFISILNLLGLPSLRGFFSKDLVLEIIRFSSGSIVVMLILFLNVWFTYFYTYQLFYYSFQYSKVTPYQTPHSPSLFHGLLLCLIGIMTLLYGYFFISVVYYSTLFLPVPTLTKFLPLFLNGVMFLCLLLFISQLKIRNKPLHFYFSNIIHLSNVMMPIIARRYSVVLFELVRSIELGRLSYSLNGFSSNLIYSVSLVGVKIRQFSPLKGVLVALILGVSILLIF